MKMREILDRKGHSVVTISEGRSVLDAVKRLVEHGIGGLVVTEGDSLRGIITERDVLRLTARAATDLDSIRVGDAMTREVVTAAPDDGMHEMMGVMTERRIRHLPVVDDERLVGIVSIGDLVNACRTLAEQENAHLREYIQGPG